MAPGSKHSLYLQGGNDANFGMTLKLPSAKNFDDSSSELNSPSAPPTDVSEEEDPSVLNGEFKPSAVSFYVRTSSEDADAGHFILGESNEVNRRVAQFQFTRDGNMGLLGTGGTTHGATPYEANRWYHVLLRFDWTRKTVAFLVDGKLLQQHVPFRREVSSFIGACALGNRDQCTTWFDSICFVHERTLERVSVPMRQGVAEVWLGPFDDRCAKDGFVIRVEDEDGSRQSSEVAGPFHPMDRIESSQRVAINSAALADISSLISDECTADVTFVVEGREVPAHRCILAARCETFRRMFNSSMREGQRENGQKVEIAEASYAAFFCMLRFIYGGSVTVPEELAVELLGLADRYLLDGLKLLCGFTLTNMVSVDTVASILQAADRWDSPSSQLKAHCLSFVLEHYDDVVNSSAFEELTLSPHLLLAVTRAAANIVAPPLRPRSSSWDSNRGLERQSKRQRVEPDARLHAPSGESSA